MGLHRAGFEVVGVDIEPQPNYPFEFHQADALNFPLDGFDLIWASPPCQRYSAATKRWTGRAKGHPDLAATTRDLLAGRLFVLENVPGSPLRPDLTLCGFMFPELAVIRHRIFEIHGATVSQPAHVPHKGRRGLDYFTVAGHSGGKSTRDKVRIGSFEEWSRAMGIDWMTSKELSQAIPPAYSEWIARQLLEPCT